MAGEAYQVDYIINLQDNASAGITKFSQAASKLANATKNFDMFQKRFNEMTVTFNKQLELKISTSRASTKLNRVIKQLNTIQDLSKGINVGVVGSVGSSAANKKVVTTTITTQATQTTRAKQPQGPRPIVAPKGRQPLVPRNLEYQVLGPTRLGNVAMLDMFKGMGVMYGISAVGSGMRDIISQSTEYENIMQTAKNILNTNYNGGNFNASFADMERIVREVGVETKFTAPEVADAVKFLAMAGLDINAINKSIRPIADIALIGDTDLGQTADVMTNIMTAYGINPNDMRKTADVMTRTFTMSNTTLMELAESFKMAGSMLHLANVPFETAAAAFGVLGDAGIKATMAGTTMRTIMNNLRNPTKNQQKYWDMLQVRRYDDFGNLREINDIFGDLFKLNNNNERKEEATKAYEDLQKKYATRFEGLQEGSDDWKKVWEDYDKESEAIRKQFGGVDVFRLFRLTAASGAGVLMNSVEKWNKIISENFLSDGLSQKLADEKKNQIAGLWAQLKSAFQEGGLKVFEENDGKIRGYLQRGISWLKSDEFTDVLRSVVDLVEELGRVLLNFTRVIVYLYNKFGPLIKRFLEFQLLFKGLQTVLVSFKQFKNALLYMGSFGRAGALMYGSSKLAGTSGIGVGGGMNTIGRFGSRILYGDPLRQARRDANWMNVADNDIIVANRNNRMLLQKYQKKRDFKMANMQKYSAYTMLGGSALGGYIGNNFDEDNGMMWGSLIGGGLGAIAPLLAGSGPWGVVIGGAVIAITGLASAYVKYKREVAKAKEETDRFVSSLRTLNMDKISLDTADNVFNANIRITTSLLHTENEKLQLQLQLLKRLRDEKDGTPDAYNSNTSADVVKEVKQYRDKYWNNTILFETERKALINELTEKGVLTPVGDERYRWYSSSRSNFYELTDSEGNSVKYNDITGEYWDSAEPLNALAALKAAFSPDNPFLNQARTTWMKLSKDVVDVESYNEAVKQFWSKLGLPEMSHAAGDIDELKDSDFDAMLTDNSLLEYPEYRVPINKQLEKIVEAGAPFRNFIETIEGFDFGAEGVTLPMKEAQEYISTHIPGPYFDKNKFGVFGTPEWASRMMNYANTATDENGAPRFIKGSEGDQWAREIYDIYELFLGFFKNLPDELKPFYYPYLNKTYWESLGGKVNLGELEGMYQPKNQEESPMYPGYKFGQFGGYAAWFNENENLTIPGYWTMPTQQQSGATPTPEMVATNAADSLHAYTPRIIPMYPEIQKVDITTDVANASAQVVDMMAGMNRATTVEEPWRSPYILQPYVDENALGNSLYASLQPWLTKINPLSPVTNEEVDRVTAEPLYAAFAPSYEQFLPPIVQPAVSNEAFRPSERQQVAMVARPVVVNINADKLMDFSSLNIDNATDDVAIAQRVRDALENILAEVAESTGGNYNIGAA